MKGKKNEGHQCIYFLAKKSMTMTLKAAACWCSRS
jgi:hypothetical protein